MSKPKGDPITSVQYDNRVRHIAKRLEPTVLGGSIVEVHTGSREDNYVSLMLRDSDMELIDRLVSVLECAESTYRRICKAAGWGYVEDSDVLENFCGERSGIAHLATVAPNSEDYTNDTVFGSWFDCWHEAVDHGDSDE